VPMPSTAVFSFRLPGKRAENLKRIARRLERSAAEVAARLSTKASGRPNSPGSSSATRLWAAGLCQRQPFGGVAGGQVGRQLPGKCGQTAQHLRWPEARVKAALTYAKTFREEIDQALADAQSFTPNSSRKFYFPGSDRGPAAALKESNMLGC